MIPTQWRQRLARIGSRGAVRVGVIAVALIAGGGVDRLCRPRLHIESGAILVAPDADSRGQAPEVIRNRLGQFLADQRARLAGDGFLAPAVMALAGVDDRSAAGMVDTLRDRLCVETALADDAPRGTIFITVAWPEDAVAPGEGRAKRAAATCYCITGNLLNACVVEHNNLRQQRERESPVARMMQAAQQDADNARKALDAFLADAPAEQLAAIAGGGLAGMQNALADTAAKARRLDEQRRDNQARIGAVERELAEAGKDPSYRLHVPPSALAEPPVAEASKSVAACESKITALAAGGDNAKALAQSRAERDAHRRELIAALQRHLAGLKEADGRLQARQAGAVEAWNADRQALSRGASSMMRYQLLKDDYESARDALRAARAAEPQARQAENRDHVGFEVSLFRKPGLPDPARPYRPITWPSVLAGLATAIVLVGAWLLVVERWLAGAAAAPARAQTSGAEVLATIPRIRGGAVVRTE